MTVGAGAGAAGVVTADAAGTAGAVAVVSAVAVAIGKVAAALLAEIAAADGPFDRGTVVTVRLTTGVAAGATVAAVVDGSTSRVVSTPASVVSADTDADTGVVSVPNNSRRATAGRTDSVGAGTTEAAIVGAGATAAGSVDPPLVADGHGTGTGTPAGSGAAVLDGAGWFAAAIAPVKPITAVAAKPVAATRPPRAT